MGLHRRIQRVRRGPWGPEVAWRGRWGCWGAGRAVEAGDPGAAMSRGEETGGQRGVPWRTELPFAGEGGRGLRGLWPGVSESLCLSHSPLLKAALVCWCLRSCHTQGRARVGVRWGGKAAVSRLLDSKGLFSACRHHLSHPAQLALQTALPARPCFCEGSAGTFFGAFPSWSWWCEECEQWEPEAGWCPLTPESQPEEAGGLGPGC